MEKQMDALDIHKDPRETASQSTEVILSVCSFPLTQIFVLRLISFSSFNSLHFGLLSCIDYHISIYAHACYNLSMF